jgi:hypothetical protein
MPPAVLEIAKTIGALVGLLTGVFVTYWQIRQRTMSRDLKLADNPERCGQHEEAIATLKARFETLDERNEKDHGEMFRQLGLMSVEIAKLGRNGGGGK